MAEKLSKGSPSARGGRKSAAGRTALVGESRIRFVSKLLRPVNEGMKRARGGDEWTFLVLPKEASAALPSRGMVSVEGLFEGSSFRATLEPDGTGGHWLKVDRALRKSLERMGAKVPVAGENVMLEITPVGADREPEPVVPADLRKALAAAPKPAREAWADITPAARRDWIFWITSGKKAETRVNRVATACDMLAKGKRRPCCFDRSGMYSQSLRCPTAEVD